MYELAKIRLVLVFAEFPTIKEYSMPYRVNEEKSWRGNCSWTLP
jgi:hypothetical protein